MTAHQPLCAELRALGPDEIRRAHNRIIDQVRRTPVMTAPDLDARLGLELFFKCEHLQATGSFKLRGASHAISLLGDEIEAVATHSSGNHGAALARAAAARGLSAHVVMPENSARCKIEATRANGAHIHFCQPSQAARENALADLVARGYAPVPPYDDVRIIAGQGTCVLEMLEQVDALDAIVTPVGGGGLLAGTALAVQDQRARPKVIGAEPLGADDTARSLAAGRRIEDHRPETIADGLRALVGETNLAVIERFVERVVTVTEDQIVDAMLLIWRYLKQVVEPSAAVALAGLIERADDWRGGRVGIILSGGNLDLERFRPLLR